eukprot:4176876-Prymnesium_polylepis.1
MPDIDCSDIECSYDAPILEYQGSPPPHKAVSGWGTGRTEQNIAPAKKGGGRKERRRRTRAGGGRMENA